MSLYLTYRRHCDGPVLADRLGADLRAIQTSCYVYGPGAEKASQAMSRARKEGWIRHSRDMPILTIADRPDVTSKQTFDLCPACSPELVGK